MPNLERFLGAAIVIGLSMLGPEVAAFADTQAQPQTPPELLLPAELRLIADTATAIEACYHWGGEVGDQSEERNKQIDEGIASDCPKAEKLAQHAYKQYPKNSALAYMILELIEMGYFPVSDSEKKQICETATAQFKQQFLESNQRDELFSDECADEASKVYGKL